MSTEAPAAAIDDPSAERSPQEERPPSRTAVFDLAFGVALPVVCVYFDPIVFRSSTFGAPLVGEYRVVALVAIGLGLVSLPAWVIFRRPASLLAGLLAGSAVFSASLGLVLLPFSVIGLAFFIGALGFSPFLTAFVFWRSAARAYRAAHQQGQRARVIALVAAGLFVSCAGPWAAHWYVTHEVTRATELVVSGTPGEAEQGVRVLKRLRLLADLDPIALAYEDETDESRQSRLAAAYVAVTGERIEYRLSILRD